MVLIQFMIPCNYNSLDVCLMDIYKESKEVKGYLYTLEPFNMVGIHNEFETKEGKLYQIDSQGIPNKVGLKHKSCSKN